MVPPGSSLFVQPDRQERAYWVFAVFAAAIALMADSLQRGPIGSDLLYLVSGPPLVLLALRRVLPHKVAICIHIALAMLLLAYETRFAAIEKLSGGNPEVLHQTQSAFIILGVLALSVFGGRFGFLAGILLAGIAKHHAPSELMSFTLAALIGAAGLVWHHAAQSLAASRMQLETIAFVDALTGLPNLRAAKMQFEIFTAVAKRAGFAFTLMVWDLDHLKAVNDREGHAAGDRYINAFCRHLQGCLRKGDVAFRMGGDEFLSFHLRLENGELLATRVREHFAQVSVGWASDPDASFDTLVGLADARMYEDKAARRESSPGPLARTASAASAQL
jgi:GGDEF domain-containing protein